jgi:PPK2 family polyphosphate:nucleotide phosphotransferase
VAGEQLARHAAALKRAIDDIESDDDVKRAHKARIAAKRLRYLLEPAARTSQRDDSLLRRLRKLQDELGTLHDFHVFLETVAHARHAHPSRGRRKGLKALEARLKEETRKVYRRLRRKFDDKAIREIEDDTERLAAMLGRHSRTSMMKLRPITRGTRLNLTDGDASPPRSAPGKSAIAKAAERDVDRIGDLQEVLYADRRFALLIVLQGRDASGKDGTVKHVFGSVNPQGCSVTSFGVPSEEESRHDFLWRVHQHVPRRGYIGIFNRSHYEDVLVPRVRRTVPPKIIAKRCEQINDFERMLAENGVVILKFFLHVSRDEQRKRLKDRLDDPKKNWKFQAGDLEDRANWSRYTAAYREALRRCSTRWAPWYLVPADDKKVRNLLVSRVIADRLEALGLRYPPAPKATRRLKVT